MDLRVAEQAIRSVKLPDWVKGWRVTEDLDSENEPMLRVWFQMEPDFDRDAMKARHKETQQAQDEIRQALREAGVDEWMIVVWESAVRS